MPGGTKGKIGGKILHGRTRSKEWRSWVKMRERCKHKAHYIRHSVTVCDRWEQSFEAFLSDVGLAPSEEHSIDRWPNPEGNYEPGNVRWATRLEQRHNRRPNAGRASV